MPITYTNHAAGLAPEHLTGFFVGWKLHPDPATHLEILRRSHAIWIALDGVRCVGFINAISDQILTAYIPLLEVLPDYQGRGIGTELVRRMSETLAHLYAVDVVCNEDTARFYATRGFRRYPGMVRRNYASQSGRRVAVAD